MAIPVRGLALALGLTAVIVAVTACAPGLGDEPLLQSPADLAAARSLKAPDAAWPKDDWWTAFNDPQLTKLIETGLAGAPDMAIAEARLRQAEAQAEVAGAAELPSASADYSAQAYKPNVNNGFPNFIKPFLPHSWHTQMRAALNLNYELDFWGKNRASLRAATSQAEAAEAEAAQARLTLSTSIAGAYADLVRLQADRVTAADAVRVRKDSAVLVESQVRHGIENEGQSAQARAQIAIAQGQADQIDQQIAHTRHQIAALLGKGPDYGLDIAASDAMQRVQLGLPATLQADLVGRRADIVAARLQAEAAAQQIRAARAAYYPDINLTAQIGALSLNPSDFADKGSIFGTVGPAIHLPVFTGGQIEGSYRGARARYDEAVAVYNKTLAHAFEDVADAITDERALTGELRDAEAALHDSEKAYEIAKLRYRGGLSRYLDVLTAENTVLLQRRQLTDFQAQAYIDNLALIRALGGGYAAATPKL